MDEAQIRERFCLAVRQLWTRGMIVGADGLLCCEVHRRRYLATPVGLRRIDLTPADLICVDIGGENVHGGEGIPTELWQPHRDVFQSHIDPAGVMLGASALIEPPNVLALLSKHDGAQRLDLGGGESIPIVDGDNDQALRAVLTDSTDAVLRGCSRGCSRGRGRGLFVAGSDLAQTLNRIERIELAARVRLAVDGA
jgi:ribulose-5-phosphate 4-epimerase/fuculose-1-phosphate aldolase